jgi:hypothetical protein
VGVAVGAGADTSTTSFPQLIKHNPRARTKNFFIAISFQENCLPLGTTPLGIHILTFYTPLVKLFLHMLLFTTKQKGNYFLGDIYFYPQDA